LQHCFLGGVAERSREVVWHLFSPVMVLGLRVPSFQTLPSPSSIAEKKCDPLYFQPPINNAIPTPFFWGVVGLLPVVPSLFVQVYSGSWKVRLFHGKARSSFLSPLRLFPFFSTDVVCIARAVPFGTSCDCSLLCGSDLSLPPLVFMLRS